MLVMSRRAPPPKTDHSPPPGARVCHVSRVQSVGGATARVGVHGSACKVLIIKRCGVRWLLLRQVTFEVVNVCHRSRSARSARQREKFTRRRTIYAVLRTRRGGGGPPIATPSPVGRTRRLSIDRTYLYHLEGYTSTSPGWPWPQNVCYMSPCTECTRAHK